MICPSSGVPHCTESAPSCSAPEPAESPDGCSSLYGWSFWTAYVANTLVTVAYAILFRYADFVTILGGTELHLGWIVGVGMIGSVLARLSLGTAIDQHGPRLIWLASLVVFAISCFAHLAVGRCDGPEIYLLRLLYCTAIAGIFGASTTFISGRVNIARMAELVGLLGTSGFVGMMLGTQLGDLLLGSGQIHRPLVDRLFVVAGLLGLAAMPFAWASTRRLAPREPRAKTPVLAVVRRYQPGFVLVIGVVAGAAFCLPQTFLRTYAEELNIPRIGMFFTIVAVTEVATRVITRHLPDRLGLSTMIFVGLGLMAVAQVLYLVVRCEWQLLLPGLPYGLAQGILYPMVAAVGTGTFPLRYRGLGITLVLASFDVGQLIGAPVAGGILHACDLIGVAGYPTLFLITAATLVLAGGAYWWFLQRAERLDRAVRRPAIVRFPRTVAERQALVSASRRGGPADNERIIPSRSLAGSSRSTAAGRR